MFGSIGMPELVIILVIALIIFGPRKLPELGRSLGRSIGEFKKASNELRSTLEEEIRIEEQRDSRSAMKAEQASAVAAGTATASPAEPTTPATPPVEEHTVSRSSGTGPTV
jgi:sec-independent protein translocase protein TatA